MSKLDITLKQVQQIEKKVRAEERSNELLNKQLKKEFKQVIPELKTLFKISNITGELQLALNDGSTWNIKDGVIRFLSKNYSCTIQKIFLYNLEDFTVFYFYHVINSTHSWVIGTLPFSQWAFIPENALSDSDTRETMQYFLDSFSKVIQKVQKSYENNYDI